MLVEMSENWLYLVQNHVFEHVYFQLEFCENRMITVDSLVNVLA